MYKALKKVMLLFLLAIAVTCGSLFAVACGGGDKGGDSKITYTAVVTIDSDVENLSFSDIKAKWLSNSVAVSDEIALNSEGKAYVDLDAGNYVVELVGVPATAKYERQSVTALSPRANFVISKVTSDKELDKLSAPVLALNGTILSWGVVENAVGYEVYADETSYLGWVDASDNADDLIMNLAMKQLSVGDHEITVVAIADGENYADSLPSAPVPYTVEAGNNDPDKLDAPTGLNIVSDILTWSAVTNSNGYAIYDGDNEIGRVGKGVTVFDLKTVTLSVGDHSIYVVALGDGENYSDSEKSVAAPYKVEPAATAEPLDKVEGLKVEQGVATWTEVAHASGYIVKVSSTDEVVETEEVLTGTSYTIKVTVPGYYLVTVTAKGDGVLYKNGEESDPEIHIVTGTLNTPTDLKIENDVLSWTGDVNASGYTVYEGEKVIATSSETSVNLKTINFEVGDHYLSVVANGDEGLYGEVIYYSSAKSAEIKHTVSVAKNVPQGGTDYWYDIGIAFDEDWKHEVGEPYAITAEGTYYIPLGTKKVEGEDPYTGYPFSEIRPNVHTIKFTAYEEGEHSYMFTWDTSLYTLSYLNYGSSSIEAFEDYTDESVANNDSNGYIIFNLEKGAEVTLLLRYIVNGELAEGVQVGYELTVEADDPITEGSIYLPYLVFESSEGEPYTAPEGVNEAYFAFFAFSKGNFKVNYGDGIVKMSYAYSIDNEFETLLDGDSFKAYESGKILIKVVGTEGKQISFTVERFIPAGSVTKPIELTKGEDTYSFVDDWEPLWFTYTTGSESQWYRFEINYSELTVYSKLTYVDWSDSYYGDEEDQVGRRVTPNGVKDVYLQANTKYFIKLDYYEEAVTLKLSDTPVEAGGVLNPKALAIGKNEVDLSVSDLAYLVYTADIDGTLNVNFIEGEMYGVYLFVYSDANFSVIYDKAPDGHFENFSLTNITAGTKIYFFLEASYGKSEGYVEGSLEINLTAALKAPTGLSVNNKTFTWGAVAGALGYIVYEGNEVLDSNVTTNSYNLSNLSLGTHYLYVAAKGNGETIIGSNKSSSRATYYNSVQLAKPENLKVEVDEDGVPYLVWDEVENATSYKIRVDSKTANTYRTENTNSFHGLLDKNFVSEGTHIFYVTACGPDGYEESEAAFVSHKVDFPADYEVGEEYEVAHFLRKTIKFEGGKTYTVKLTGDYANHFIVRDTGDGHTWSLKSNQSNVSGELIIPGATSLAVAFTVDADKGGTYTIIFIDNEALTLNETESHTCKVQFVEGDSSVPFEGPKEFVLDQEQEITVKASATVDYTFTTTLPGIYKITLKDITGEGYSVKVNDGEPIIDGDFGATTATFEDKTEYSADGLNSFDNKISIYSGKERTFKVLITYVKPGDIELTLNGNAGYGAITGFAGKTEEDEEAEVDVDTLGKLVLNGLTSGTKYTIVVTQSNANSGDFKLIYNGSTYDSYSSSNHNNYAITFEAAEAAEAYIYVIVSSENHTIVRLKLVDYIEGDEPDGLRVGDKAVVLPGDGTANATLVEFDKAFEEGVKYTIKLTDVEQMSAWNYTYVVIYNGEQIAEAEGSALTFSFTAVADAELKICSTLHYGMTGGNNGTLYNVTLTITVVEAPSVEPDVPVDGLAVGGEYTISGEEAGYVDGFGPGMGGKFITLVGVTVGSSYKITLVPGGPGDFGKTFTILYNDEKIAVSSNDYTATITIVEGQNTIKVLANTVPLAAPLVVKLAAA